MQALVFIAALTIILGISYLWNILSVKGLELSQGFEKERIFLGDTVNYMQELTNKKLFPLPWIKVETEVPNEIVFLKGKLVPHNKPNKKILSGVYSLLWYQKIRRRYPVFPQNRGIFFFGPVTLTTGDLLGFFHKEMKIYNNAKLIVYPRIVDITVAEGIPDITLSGVSGKKKLFSDPFSFSGKRDYFPGDSLKDVDWKSSAKFDRLLVKVFDSSYKKRVSIILDVNTFENAWEGIDPELSEFLIMLTASIAKKAIYQGCEVMLASNGRMISDDKDTDIITLIPYGVGSIHLKTILEALARLDNYSIFKIDDIFPKVLDILKKGSRVVYITANWGNSGKKVIKLMKKINLDVALVLVGKKNAELKGPEGITTYHAFGEEKWREIPFIELV
ncbi:MAG: DUF58 domain-containing protein [Thermovenabulum sp.]|uniref:DUF58 domain-containing protein n=1 Tax=Thermovenabulum sp. TaxID=3100335 RepID=UPI003C7B07D6